LGFGSWAIKNRKNQEEVRTKATDAAQRVLSRMVTRKMTLQALHLFLEMGDERVEIIERVKF